MITRLPGAIWSPLSYAGNARPFASPPRGWLLHVVVGNGDPGPYWETLTGRRQAFAHGWVAKDGHSRQYQGLDMQAWHASGANPLYWGFETEGYPGEPLTPAQIQTLATWHVALGTPDVLVGQPSDPGIGCHYQGGAAWGGHDCPDSVPGSGPRSRQRTDILAAAALLRTGGTIVTKDDAQLFVTALAGWDVSAQIGSATPVNFQTAFGRLFKTEAANAADLDTLKAEVTYLANLVAALVAATHPAPVVKGAPANVPPKPAA